MARDEARERAAYRTLIRLLPRAFTLRWGADMEDVFVRRLDGAGGRAGRAWVWLRAGADVVTQAVGERLGRGDTGMHDGWRREGMKQDLGYAVRSLAGAPMFSLTAVSTLALGLGAAVATFSVVWAVLLKPLPYQEPDRLVAVWPALNFNVALVREAEEALPALDGITGVSMWTLTMSDGPEPMELDAAMVSADHFRVLGVQPAMGRGFLPEEALPGAGRVAVLSHDLWVGAFGADPDIVGRVIRVSGAEHDAREVIGVMAAGHRPVRDDPDLWIPLEGDPAASVADDATWYVNERIARLAPGATVAQATEQLAAFAQRVRADVPGIVDEADVQAATIEPLRAYTAGDLTAPLWAALGAVALVLLIACANAANLLLARGDQRAGALSVRAALGAGRDRILRLVLLESLLLGAAAGGLGVLIAYGLVGVLVRQAPADFPRLDEVGVSLPVLAFAVVVAVACTLLAGLVPAVRAGRVDAMAALGRSTRGSAARRTSRLTHVLVAGQVGLAVVVAVGSGLMLRSLDRLLSEDMGLDAEGVLTFRANPGEDRYPDAVAFARFYEDLIARLSDAPGVESASAIHLLPGTRSNWSFPTWPEGVVHPDGEARPSTNFRAVYPGYFETLGIPLLQGRSVQPGDREDTERVVVVNRAFAERWWPGQDPIGRTVRVFSSTATPYRVVGVVGDVRQFGLDRPPAPELYYSPRQWDWQISQSLVVRYADGDPLAHAEEVRRVVREVDPRVPVTDVAALDGVVGQSARTTRFLTLLLSAFGALAVFLGAVGVFGVTAYVVGRRTAEFGVRLALGSTRHAVVGTAVRGTLGPVVAGLGLGVVGAWTASRLLASALYGVEPTDPVTFTAVPALLLAVGTLAALAPAWRAGRVDPVEVLGGD